MILTFYFDIRSTEFNPTDMQYNLTFLAAQHHRFNQYLQTKGYVFLNEILEALGKPILRTSSVNGWAAGWMDKSKGIGFEYHVSDDFPYTIELIFNLDEDILSKLIGPLPGYDQ